MAYGQTGTGKTYTLGQLGEEDPSARGIMVRSMEEILANTCLETDSVSVSYLQVYTYGVLSKSLDKFAVNSIFFSNKSISFFMSMQLYMETIQDLLNPANDNIAIIEDQISGDISLPGATVVEVRDHQSFLELLQLGEGHRYAANTRMNTESSRSHAILMVNDFFLGIQMH